ncbi:MAG: 23S rRNA (pseudouridine(1915)-N(3))-methyltransferase RlmH [Erysipelotrichaceae bacterium]|jgi:23S rRNA (pseudouridine1915-N3)-methyltransferase|nr:23S rRNA (pseudouridine(1915)-N(3))-methyltransferase RlmH [Erysipelotrichaceae bacterium]
MIKIIAVGKIKEKSLKKLIDDYVKRISYYSSVKIIEVNDEPNSKKTQDEIIKNIEGQRVLKHIKDNDYVYLLDLNGKEYDSLSFSKSIDDVMTYKSSDIVFVIGGSLGLSDELIKRSDIRWKLSNCTFPHQIVRLLLVEQIYRAFSILNNLPYHK